MRCISYFLSFLILLSTVNMAASAPIPANLEDILRGIEHYQFLLKSGRGVMLVKDITTDAGKKDTLSRLKLGRQKNMNTYEEIVVFIEDTASYSFEDTKFRYEAKLRQKTWDGKREREEKSEIQQAYDGETLGQLKTSPDGISATLFPNPNMGGTYRPPFNPREWAFYTFAAHLAKHETVLDHIKSNRPELVGTEMVDGDLCYVIKLSPKGHPDSQKPDNRIWVDPEKGYGLVKLQFSYKDSLYVNTIKYKEISKDLWVPYYHARKAYHIDPDTGKKILMSEQTMEITDFQANADIPDDVFKMKFEKGTQVFDVRTRKPYTVQ